MHAFAASKVLQDDPLLAGACIQARQGLLHSFAFHSFASMKTSGSRLLKRGPAPARRVPAPWHCMGPYTGCFIISVPDVRASRALLEGKGTKLKTLQESEDICLSAQRHSLSRTLAIRKA